jgi:2-oxoglutarate ferredoxin oxidoreductase subunit gamma
MQKEIRLCGFGGQGIVLAGVVLGEAAVRAGFWAVQTQSYGPEARGGAARSEVVIASTPIDFPRVQKPDVIVALSQAAYEKYKGDLHDGCLVVVEKDLVTADGAVGLPFVRTAEEVGHKIVANIVMLGYLGALLDLIPPEILEATVLEKVPRATASLNQRAARAGRELFATSRA